MTGEQRQQERANETIKQIMDERRLRMAYVRADLLLNWFANGMERPEKGFITYIDDVPANTILLGVDYHIETGGFKFLLGNLEFDPVPEGEYPKPLTISIRQFDNGQ
jgi:hypothetical protein